IGESQDIYRLDVSAQFRKAAVVQKLCQPLAHRQTKVVVALRADAEVALQALVVHERVAGGALDPPDILGRSGWSSRPLHGDKLLTRRRGPGYGDGGGPPVRRREPRSLQPGPAPDGRSPRRPGRPGRPGAGWSSCSGRPGSRRPLGRERGAILLGAS